MALADALKVNTSLTTLYLSGSQIGPEGAAALADAKKVRLEERLSLKSMCKQWLVDGDVMEM